MDRRPQPEAVGDPEPEAVGDSAQPEAVCDPAQPEAVGDPEASRDSLLARRKQSAQLRLGAAEVRYRALAEARPVLGLPFPFLAAYQRLNCALLAGSLAFRLFMWLLPFALLVAGLGSLIVGETNWDVGKAVQGAGVSGSASRQVVQAMNESHQSWWVAVLLGLALLLWTGRSLSRALTMLHAHIWEMPVPRQSQWRRLLDGAWLFLVFMFALVASVLTSHLHIAGWFLGSAVLTVLLSAGWLFVSTRLPHRAPSWRDLVPGALAVGLGLATLKTFSTVYLPHKIERASQLYGTLGVAGSILLWLFILGQIVVCGALLNAIWTRYAHPPADEPS